MEDYFLKHHGSIVDSGAFTIVINDIHGNIIGRHENITADDIIFDTRTNGEWSFMRITDDNGNVYWYNMTLIGIVKKLNE